MLYSLKIQEYVDIPYCFSEANNLGQSEVTLFLMFFFNIGFQLSDILVCIQWMQSFVTVTNRTKLASQKTFKGVSLILSVVNHSTCTYIRSYKYLYLITVYIVRVCVCVAPVFSVFLSAH